MYPHINFLGLSIETYFLYLSLLFTLIVPFIIYRAKKKNLNVNTALDLYLVVICLAFLGARLFYVFYQELDFYLKYPLEIFYFWKGGFVFYGGFLGGLLGGVLLLKKKNEDWLKWANFSAPILSLSYAFGRISCLLAGCCYGVKTDAWYSVFLHGAYRHPAQGYAFIFEFLVFLSLILLEKKKVKNIFFIWLILHGFGRIIMEFFRADPRGAEILGLSVSTVISFGLIAGSIFLYIKSFKANDLK